MHAPLNRDSKSLPFFSQAYNLLPRSDSIKGIVLYGIVGGTALKFISGKNLPSSLLISTVYQCAIPLFKRFFNSRISPILTITAIWIVNTTVLFAFVKAQMISIIAALTLGILISSAQCLAEIVTMRKNRIDFIEQSLSKELGITDKKTLGFWVDYILRYQVLLSPVISCHTVSEIVTNQVAMITGDKTGKKEHYTALAPFFGKGEKCDYTQQVLLFSISTLKVEFLEYDLVSGIIAFYKEHRFLFGNNLSNFFKGLNSLDHSPSLILPIISRFISQNINIMNEINKNSDRENTEKLIISLLQLTNRLYGKVEENEIITVLKLFLQVHHNLSPENRKILISTLEGIEPNFTLQFLTILSNPELKKDDIEEIIKTIHCIITGVIEENAIQGLESDFVARQLTSEEIKNIIQVASSLFIKNASPSLMLHTIHLMHRIYGLECLERVLPLLPEIESDPVNIEHRIIILLASSYLTNDQILNLKKALNQLKTDVPLYFNDAERVDNKGLLYFMDRMNTIVKEAPKEHRGVLCERLLQLGMTPNSLTILSNLTDTKPNERCKWLKLILEIPELDLIKQIDPKQRSHVISSLSQAISSFGSIFKEDKENKIENYIKGIQVLTHEEMMTIFRLSKDNNLDTSEIASFVNMMILMSQFDRNRMLQKLKEPSSKDNFKWLIKTLEIVPQQGPSFFDSINELFSINDDPDSSVSIFGAINQLTPRQRQEVLWRLSLLRFSLHISPIEILRACKFLPAPAIARFLAKTSEFPGVPQRFLIVEGRFIPVRTPPQFLIQMVLMQDPWFTREMHDMYMDVFTSTDEKEAQQLASGLWEDQGNFLGFFGLHQDHPIANRALAIVTNMQDPNDLKNAYSLNRKIINSSNVIADVTPGRFERGSRVLSLNMETFRERAKAVEPIKGADLIKKGITLETIIDLFEMGEITPAKDAYIYNNLTSPPQPPERRNFAFFREYFIESPDVQKLLRVDPSDENVNPNVNYFFTILEYLRDVKAAYLKERAQRPESDISEITEESPFLPHEVTILSNFASLLGCSEGFMQGIPSVYNTLPTTYTMGMVAMDSSETNAIKFVNFFVQRFYEQQFNSENSLMFALTGETGRIVERAHQSHFVKGMIAHVVGYVQKHWFDPDGANVATALASRSQEEILQIFYEHVTPITLVEALKLFVEQQASSVNLFGSFNMLLGLDPQITPLTDKEIDKLESEGQRRALREKLERNDIEMKEVWDVGTDPISLTEEGAIRVLLATGYLEEFKEDSTT